MPPRIPQNPTRGKIVNFEQNLRFAQSVYTSLNGGITLASGRSTDATGVYNKFDMANGSGKMVRIGATGSTEPLKWNSGTSQATIIHQLGTKPTGFLITDLDGNAVIWRVGAPTNTQITLQISVNTVNATVYVF
jgi:hypothetical protein